MRLIEFTISENVHLNFLITILPTWALLKDWLRSSIFLKLTCFMQTLCWMTCSVERYPKVCNRQEFRRKSGINVSKPMISRNICRNSSKKIWRHNLFMRTPTIKWKTFYSTFQLKTFKKVTSSKLLRNPSINSNSPIDQLPLIFSRQFTKTRK